MANNNKRPVAKGNINKKKLPRWLVVTIVVAVVLLAIAAIAAAPFLTATADKEATIPMSIWTLTATCIIGHLN